MTKRAKTARVREKQLEKELSWGMIPPELHVRFRQAELKQWGESRACQVRRHGSDEHRGEPQDFCRTERPSTSSALRVQGQFMV